MKVFVPGTMILCREVVQIFFSFRSMIKEAVILTKKNI